jgi:hypothetical protein
VACLLYTTMTMVLVADHQLAGTCYLLHPASVEVAAELRSSVGLAAVVGIVDGSMLVWLAVVAKSPALALFDEGY